MQPVPIPALLWYEIDMVFDMLANKPSPIIKVLAFDPGLTAMGWSLLAYNTDTHNIMVLKYGTIYGKNALKTRKEMHGGFTKQFITLMAYESIVSDMIRNTAPDYISVEGAFMCRFPAAFAALSAVINVIRRCAHLVTNKDIHEIAPMESKKAASATGTASKSTVQEALLTNPDIDFKSKATDHLEDMTEHSADSIACGLAFIKNKLPTIRIQAAIVPVTTTKKK